MRKKINDRNSLSRLYRIRNMVACNKQNFIDRNKTLKTGKLALNKSYHAIMEEINKLEKQLDCNK